MLLIAASAILFQRAAPSPWAQVYAANGPQLLVSPIGIRDLGSDSLSEPAVACRWWPKLGDAALCAVAPGGDDDVAKVRRAYPLTFAALWVSVLALFIVALRVPRKWPYAGIAVTAAVPVIAFIALRGFASGFRNAFVVLQGARIAVEPGGFNGISLGAFLMAVAVGLLITSRVLQRT